MTQKKNQTGVFAEVKVADRPQKQTEYSVNDSQWRYLKISYPNGVSITVPSSIEPGRLASLINIV